MVCLPEYKSGRAELSFTGAKADKEYFVRLPDGYLIGCGGGTDAAVERACAIVDLVNVLMKWEGKWPPSGNMESIVYGNVIGEYRWRASQGEPVPDITGGLN
jgi:hypothetical protein